MVTGTMTTLMIIMMSIMAMVIMMMVQGRVGAGVGAAQLRWPRAEGGLSSGGPDGGGRDILCWLHCIRAKISKGGK